MSNIVKRLREVQRLRGDTFSSYEVIGLIGQAADEIERLVGGKMNDCPHEFWEREASVETEGLCPLCLLAEIERLRAQLVNDIKAEEEIERLETENERLRAEIELVSK